MFRRKLRIKHFFELFIFVFDYLWLMSTLESRPKLVGTKYTRESILPRIVTTRGIKTTRYSSQKVILNTKESFYKVKSMPLS
jgi:ADP-glucose pyrophosphorylase